MKGAWFRVVAAHDPGLRFLGQFVKISAISRCLLVADAIRCFPKRAMPRKRRSISSEDSDEDFDDVRHPQRNAANARERARMRVLSKAFCRLKTTLPWVPADTKLSKLDTLRLATSYIAHLRAVLMDQPEPADLHKHPLTLTWPFSFQRTDASADGPPYHPERDSHHLNNHAPWGDEVSSGQHPAVVRDKDVSYYY
ncbi:transcription factor 21 [Cylas formicarius]|uniref:transcription factor 21 n=1 Tax=Cylas formicarius TaxID=197179 RepID=UPI002958D9C4|nr:transcription factor 21 [Cylas formicarius]